MTLTIGWPRSGYESKGVAMKRPLAGEIDVGMKCSPGMSSFTDFRSRCRVRTNTVFPYRNPVDHEVDYRFSPSDGAAQIANPLGIGTAELPRVG